MILVCGLAYQKKKFSLSLSQTVVSLSLLRQETGKGASKEPTYCTRVTRLARRNTRTLTLTHKQTQTHTHTDTHTPRRSHAEKQKTEKKTSRDDITVFFARNGVDWQ